MPAHVVTYVSLAPNGEVTVSASRLDKFAGDVSDSPGQAFSLAWTEFSRKNQFVHFVRDIDLLLLEIDQIFQSGEHNIPAQQKDRIKQAAARYVAYRDFDLRR